MLTDTPLPVAERSEVRTTLETARDLLTNNADNRAAQMVVLMMVENTLATLVRAGDA
jgi:hypothetical protein